MKACKPKIGARKVTAKTKMFLGENKDRNHLLVINKGTATVELLDTKDGKYGDGIPILAGSSYTNEHCQGAYWIVAESGTQDVRVEEDVTS